MAFWSGEKIVAEQKLQSNIISPFDPDCIDCNAYTMHMGGEYYVTASRTDGSNTKVLLTSNQPFSIPPGQFAFLLTKEALDVPANAMAFISMKATYKFQGLINVSGFHVDPGYKGQLVFSVYNAGSNAVALAEGVQLFLVWFADLDRTSGTDFVRSKAGPKSISNELLKGMSGKILSLQSLSEEIELLRRDMSVQRVIFNWAVGLATVFMVTLITGLAIAFFSDYLQAHHTVPMPVSQTAQPSGTVIQRASDSPPSAPPPSSSTIKKPSQGAVP